VSADFTASATHWAALATRYLGWRPHEFWRATPAELATALSDPEAPAHAAPSREQIARMMERDCDG
jgi:hypothetical protein